MTSSSSFFSGMASSLSQWGETSRRADILLSSRTRVAALGEVLREAFDDLGERPSSKAVDHVRTTEDSIEHRCSLLAVGPVKGAIVMRSPAPPGPSTNPSEGRSSTPAYCA